MRLLDRENPGASSLLTLALAANLRTSIGSSVQRFEQRSGVYRPERRLPPKQGGGKAA